MSYTTPLQPSTICIVSFVDKNGPLGRQHAHQGLQSATSGTPARCLGCCSGPVRFVVISVWKPVIAGVELLSILSTAVAIPGDLALERSVHDADVVYGLSVTTCFLDFQITVHSGRLLR